MEINKNGLHYVHYVSPSKVLIIFAIVLFMIVILMNVYEIKERHKMQLQINRLQDYYVKMTGEIQ